MSALICCLPMRYLVVILLHKYLGSTRSLSSGKSSREILSCVLVPRCFVHQRQIKSLLKQLVSLFNGTKSNSLDSLRYSFLCKKAATAKTFVTPERLSPTTSATNHHFRRTYLHVMEWIGKNAYMDPNDWGWNIQRDKQILLMMENSPCTRHTT